MTWETPKIILAVTFAAISLVGIVLAQMRPTISYPEYQIRIVSTMTSATRNPAQGGPTISKVLFARRDGSRGVQTMELFNNRPCTVTTYWDISTHQQVTAADCIAMKSTQPFVAIPGYAAWHPVDSCAPLLTADNHLAGAEMIQGVRVEKFELDDSASRSTMYMAPSYGCLVIRGLHYWKGPTGVVESTTSDEPVEVKIGSVDPGLFYTPPTYREVAPSERRNALDIYFNGAKR